MALSPSAPDTGTQVCEYAYAAAGATYDAAYLERPLIALCRSLGASRVLDLGCGNGAFCARLAREGFDVVGCDPSESGIAVAKASVPGVRFERLGVGDDPASLHEAPFDAVIAMEVVEHLYAPRQLPRFARGALKPHGHLLVSTPYHGFLKNLALSLTNAWDAHLSPLWDGGHIKFWSPPTLRRLGEDEGFTFERFAGAGRLPWLWKSMIMVFRS